MKKRLKNRESRAFPYSFCPRNLQRSRIYQDNEKTFPEETIGFVSSQTENRLEIVEGFRKREITVLISTTILERGVTFPCVDVFVVQANHYLYTASSLVQIAGRVGRSMERPTGLLQFYHEGSTGAIEKAIAEIKQMNKEAGYV